MIKMKRDKMKRTRDKNKEIDAFPKRKKFCRFCRDKAYVIDYKNMGVLEKMVGERGKILSRRVTGNCAKHQRRVCDAIKRARFLSLIPYTK